MLADMLAAGINANLAGFDQAPALVEEQCHAWLAELMGMPAGTSGLFVSSGTMANVQALAVARYAKAAELQQRDVRKEGMWAGLPLAFYGSTETHGWAKRAASVLGLGTDAYRTVGVDSDYRMNVDELAERVRKDLRDGWIPFCVIGTAGTVNTGATDDLTALAEFCRREKLWFHVDGAFGAFARLSPKLAGQVAGMEHADSLACDPHKWMSVNYECGVVLVRDAEVHKAAFANTAAYLAPATRGTVAGGLTFADRGIDLSRGFRALKFWMMLKASGVEAFRKVVENNVEQAAYLAGLVERHPELELLAPVPLNLVCFRYVPEGLAGERLNDVNREILLRLQESGVAVPSGTELAGRYAIRVANCNHRSRREDFEMLVEAVVRIGREVVGSSEERVASRTAAYD
jgi:glutamate/tyrosine decarboxylase-like PLP-dependent enzyme